MPSPWPTSTSIALLLVGAALVSTPAAARRATPGDIVVALGVGPGANLGISRLAASEGYLLINLQATYHFDSMVGAVGEFGVGAAEGTIPLRWRIGVRLTPPLDGAVVSPYLLAQLSVSQLYGVLGADLTALGARLGAGFDYSLTARWGLGVLLAGDVSGTVHRRSGLYATLEGLFYVGYRFGAESSPE